MVIFVLKRRKVVDKLFNVKYLPLLHHFKVIYQFPKHIICLVKIVANAFLSKQNIFFKWRCNRLYNIVALALMHDDVI
jgi:hypothetical protein